MSQSKGNKILIAIVVGAIVYMLDIFLAFNLAFNSWELADHLRNLGWQVDYDVFEPFGIPCCLFSPAFAAIAGAITFKIIGTRWQKLVLLSLLGLVLLIAILYVIGSVGWGAVIPLFPPTPTPLPTIPPAM